MYSAGREAGVGMSLSPAKVMLTQHKAIAIASIERIILSSTASAF
jgi:hypothetical protein